MTQLKVLGLILIVVYFALLSIFLAHYTIDSDFLVYYSTAKTIIDPGLPNDAVYIIDETNKYSIPERPQMTRPYVYSMAVAYMLAPFGFLPYYTAKALMILINIIAYFISVIIVLRHNKASDRWFVYPLILSALWIPFLQNLRAGQVNAIVLFFIVVAVLSATKKHPIMCGIFLGIAALFKIFPIAIAMVLALKNWRIILPCVAVFGGSFLIPGSLSWITALTNVLGYLPPTFLNLTQLLGLPLFCIYILMVALSTALAGYNYRGSDYFALASLAIPASLLILPVLEYHHLIVMIFPYLFLINNQGLKNIVIVFVSVLLISVAFSLSNANIHSHAIVPLIWSLKYGGLFLIWGYQAFRITKFTPSP